MSQLGSVEFKPPYFHFRLNYDRFIKDELEHHTSFELTDLLPDTFCLSTIFAEEEAHFLEGCINRVFKGRSPKKHLKEICSIVDTADQVDFSHALKEATSLLDNAFWEYLLGALGKAGLYQESTQEWLAASKYPTQVTWNPEVERDFCTFLNTLAAAIANILALPIRRKFTADYCTTKLVGHAAGRKPDITLFPVGGEPKDTGQVALWRLVQCCLEMKNSNSASAMKDVIIQLAVAASIMWATQDNRDFIIGVTRTVMTAENQHLFNIVKMDKSGISQSSQYHCGKDATFLIRLVTGLALGHSTCIGFTRSVDLESARVFDYHTNESDPIRKLNLQMPNPISNPVQAYLLKRLPKSFSSLLDSSHQSPALSPDALPPDTVIHIDEVLHISQANFGRGTVVWAGHVHRHNELGTPPSPSPVPSETPTQTLLPLPSSHPPSPANDRDQYIVKDIWHDVNRPYTEGEILQMLQGIDHIPRFRGEFVPDSYARSSSRGLRQFLNDEQYDQLVAERKVDERIRLRLVYGHPVGVSDPKARLLYKYENRIEVIEALIAIVTAHQEAARIGIIHRDMTIYNLFIVDHDDGTTSGFLGDWGFADVKGYLDQGGKRCSQPLGPRGGSDQWVQANADSETHHRTASTTFLPVEMQFPLRPKDTLAPPFVHEAHHDLQSLFLVMLALFTAFGRDQTFNEETVTAMRGFYSPLDWEEAGQWKFSRLCGSPAVFAEEVSQHIDPYWSCLKGPFTDLWEDVFSGITRHPINEKDRHLFKPKSRGREQLSDDRRRRFDNPRQGSGDGKFSERVDSCLKNDLPITHDLFLHWLKRMLVIAKLEDEKEEEEERAHQLDAEHARPRAEEDKLAAEVALPVTCDSRSKPQKLKSIGQPRDALSTESSSGLGNTADSLNSSATIQAQPYGSLILENYDERGPKAPEPISNYFTPLSCIGVSQPAQFHVPSSGAFPFSPISKHAHPDGDGDFESANPRGSKKQKSVKFGKMKNVSSRGTGKRGSRKEGGLQASSRAVLLSQLNVEE